MSNPNEAYAFVTTQSWTDHLQDRFPHAISVGENYRMIQFARSGEAAMMLEAVKVGFAVKQLTPEDTISAMESTSEYMFLVNAEHVDSIVFHFDQVNK